MTNTAEFLKGCNSTEDPDKDTYLFSFIWFKLCPGYYRALYTDLNSQLFWTEHCKKTLNPFPEKATEGFSLNTKELTYMDVDLISYVTDRKEAKTQDRKPTKVTGRAKKR